MPKKNMLAQKAQALNRKTSTSSEKGKSATSGTPGWLTKGKAKIDSQKKTGGGGGGEFTPEFWLNNKESALIRFTCTVKDLELSVARHNVRVQSKSGKPYFKQFTCTGNPKTCEGCAADNKASVRWPSLIIDQRLIEYQDYNAETKQRAKVKKSQVVKLWLPSINELDRLSVALQNYKEDKGKEIVDLSKYLVRVSRVGDKAQTSYQFTIVRFEKITDKEEKNLAKFTKKFGTLEKLLAPISQDAQRKMLGVSGAGAAEEEEEEDDTDTEDVQEIEE